MINFIKLVLSNNKPTINSGLFTVKGIIKELKLVDDINKLNNEENYISLTKTLKKICIEFKTKSNDHEMFSGIDKIILHLEKLILNDNFIKQNIILKNINFYKKNKTNIFILMNELTSIFIKCKIENNKIKILIDKKYSYLEINILIDILTENLIYLLNLTYQQNESIFTYTNAKKIFLKTIIYFVLLFEKRKIFFSKVKNYSKIYKNILEKIIHLFINKNKEINKFIKRILIDNHLKYLINKKSNEEKVFSNFVELKCYFKLQSRIKNTLKKVFSDKFLPEYLKKEIKEILNFNEIKVNNYLYQESEEYFDFIDIFNFLKWLKKNGKFYKENAIIKKNEYLEIKKDLILKNNEFLKVLNNDLDLKRHTKNVNDDAFNLFFKNLEKTFNLYFEWFTITFNYWYSFDIYFIKANVLEEFFSLLISREYQLKIEKQIESMTKFNEIFKNIFDDFELGVDGNFFSYKFNWNDTIFEEFKDVFIFMLQKCNEIHNGINKFIILFSNSI